MRGLVQRVLHPSSSSSLTALLFSPAAGGPLAFSASQWSWQGGVITLGLLSQSQLQMDVHAHV